MCKKRQKLAIGSVAACFCLEVLVFSSTTKFINRCCIKTVVNPLDAQTKKSGHGFDWHSLAITRLTSSSYESFRRLMTVRQNL